MKRLIFIALVLSPFKIWAIDDSVSVDTSSILTFDEFITRVYEHHPIGQQALLKTQQAEFNEMQSRGIFDPKLKAKWNGKEFDEKEYYDKLAAELSVPTKYGIDFRAGYTLNSGEYLNPADYTPDAGLMYAGASLNVLQGLLIDERRAQLKQAGVYYKMMQAEKDILLNDLVYQSGLAYWKWFVAFNKLNIYNKALQLSEERLKAVKSSSFLGDVPSIDTVEATIQYQNRLIQTNQAEIEFLNATAYLEVFLWQDGLYPLNLEVGTHPYLWEDLSIEQVDSSITAKMEEFAVNHPKQQLMQYKIDALEIENRLKKDKYKPQLNVNYNFLSEATFESSNTYINPENYTVGMTFSMPLFLRKERGAVKLNEVKIQESRYKAVENQAHLEYKIQAAANEWKVSVDQIAIATDMVVQSKLLLTGENKLYTTGESSLFMVNSREMNYISAKLKLLDWVYKNQKAKLSAGYAMNVLTKDLN